MSSSSRLGLMAAFIPLLISFPITNEGAARGALIQESVLEIEARATLILTGEVLALRAFEAADRDLGTVLLTDVTIRIEEVFKGDPGKDEVTVKVLGGRMGTRFQVCPDSPEFVEGERVLVFLEESGGRLRTVGWRQGKFRLADPPGGGGEDLASAACENIGVWSGSRATFQINPDFPFPEGGTPEEQAALIPCAALAWRDQSRAAFEFVLEGTSTRRGFNLSDGVNNISWVDADGGSAFATTLVGGDGVHIDAFDIVFFARTGGLPNVWSGPDEPAEGILDIAGVATHEFGHALGLLHSDLDEATMFSAVLGSGLGRRTLHASDRACVESLYGLRTEAEPAVVVLAAVPDSGPTAGGNEVFLEGLNFTSPSDTFISIDGAPLVEGWMVESCGRIRIPIMPPHGPGSVAVSVTNSIGSAVLEAAYRYIPPPPLLLSIEPTEGPTAGGIAVTVRGENFLQSAVVTIGGAPLLGQETIDAGMIRGVLPPRAEPGSVDVRIEQEGMEAILPGSFRYDFYLLGIGSADVVSGGDPARVPVRVTSPSPLLEVSFSVSYGGAGLRLEGLSTAGTAAEGAEIALVSVDDVAGLAAFRLIFSEDGPAAAFPPEGDAILGHLVLSLPAGLSETLLAPLEVAGGAIDDPLGPAFVLADGSMTVRPLAADGSLTIETASFLRGDPNGDGSVDLGDALHLLFALFGGGPAAGCPDAADMNDDGSLDLSDALVLLGHLFLGEGPLPVPYPEADRDPTPDPLPCT
jgi:hypothetical protein